MITFIKFVENLKIDKATKAHCAAQLPCTLLDDFALLNSSIAVPVRITVVGASSLSSTSSTSYILISNDQINIISINLPQSSLHFQIPVLEVA